MTKQEKAEALERARHMHVTQEHRATCPECSGVDAPRMPPFSMREAIARVEAAGLETPDTSQESQPCVGEDWRTCPACNPAGGGIPKRPTVDDVTVRKS